MDINEAIVLTENVLVHQQKRLLLFSNAKQKNCLYWFCKAYTLVTEQQLDYIKQRKFAYPVFVARVVEEFDAIFEENLQAYLQGQPIPSFYWKTVFAGFNSSGDKFLLYQFLYAWKNLVNCLDVHIQKDLPVCLVAVIGAHYQDKNRMDSLKNDFFSMTNIFHKTAEKIEKEMLETYQVPFIQVSAVLRNIFLKKYITYKVIRNRRILWNTLYMNTGKHPAKLP
ncbi:MAG: DUF5995 family protein [Sediminibacterium sp.]|nr:DUF5995 family protein [Sediminibacterium sp.]